MKIKPPPSALSSAVSTISTITLTENDKPEDDVQEESDEVHTQNINTARTLIWLVCQIDVEMNYNLFLFRKIVMLLTLRMVTILKEILKECSEKD